MIGFRNSSLHYVETTFTKRRRLIATLRLFISFAALALSLAIVGCLAQVISFYNGSKMLHQVGIVLFGEANSAPSVTLLVLCAVAAVVNFFFLIGGIVFFKRPNNKLNLVGGFFGSVALLAVVIGLAYFFTRNNDVTQDNFMSWSCKWNYVGSHAPSELVRSCRNSKFAAYATIPLTALEVIFLTLGLADFMMESRIRKMRRDSEINSVEEIHKHSIEVSKY